MQNPVLNSKGLFELTVQGQTFQFAPWPLRQWMDGYARLLAVAGEFLARAIAAANAGQAITQDSIGSLVEALMRNIGKDRDLSIGLVESLCSDGVFIDGRRVKFTVDFDRKPMLLHRVCWAAVVVQFGPLYDEMLGELRQANAALASQEKNSNEGSGTSSTPSSEAGPK